MAFLIQLFRCLLDSFATFAEMQNNQRKEIYPVKGMSCAACASSVQRILQNQEGVELAEVNFTAHQVELQFDDSAEPSKLKLALQSVGYDLDLEAGDKREARKKQRMERYDTRRKASIWSAVFALPIFILGMFYSEWLYTPFLSAALCLPVLLIWGKPFYSQAWKQAKHGQANMDTLVALSTGIAFLFSLFNTLYPAFWLSRGLEAHVYYEAAVMIITFVSIGKAIEERANGASSQALEKLINLQPSIIHSLDPNGQIQDRPLEEIKIGDEIRVNPGESIPLDGMVISGKSYVDESMLSGESMPLAKAKGDRVFAGTINQSSSFIMQCLKDPADSVLSQIIRLVEEAQASKPPIQDLVNRIAGIFVPVVLLLALLTFGVWTFANGFEGLAYGLYTAMAVLVIACPCALGLATPTAIMVGIGKGAANNILIRDSESLELAPKVNFLILDKTGTLSQGKAKVLDIQWFVDEDSYRSALLALQSQSQHPLALAIVRHLKESKLRASEQESIELIEGQGVRMKSATEGFYACGNERFVRASAIELDDHQAKALKWEQQGATVFYFFNEKELIAQIVLGDPLKVGSVEAIKTLQGMGIELMILSGDKKETTAYWAKELGIENFRAEVSPQEKGALVREFQNQGKVVAMVGDGINDSEALAQADLGIAMGHGSSIAIEAAKITLLGSDLRAIPKAIKLSKFTVRGIRQNLFWAFIYNLIGIPIAAGILYPLNGFLLDPMLAAAAMALSSMSVVLNSLRLKGKTL